MDRDLLRQSLSYHGQSLFSRLKCEQSENPDFKAIVSDLSKANFERRVGGDNALVEQFIARKADILFAPSWKSNTLVEEVLEEEEREPYAIMPPLELFMEVSYEERRNLFFMDMERGDVVIGRINSIRDFGFFLTLLCMGGGLERDIEDLELTALCPIRDVPSNGNHDDPLSYYQIGDLIRAGVKDIDRYHEKITISLQPSSVSPNLTSLKLGVLSKEELPLHYTRSGRVANDSTETYQRVMKSSLGYSNPSIVQYLLGKMGVSDTQPPSVMRGLQSKHFLEEDFATTIRKKQSASWALKCVRAGVDHFKSGRHVQAMNEYNKALEIDTNNVEALVARGALYANKGSVVKAIGDFELALETCPTHRNAKKYLCQTLVERGGQLEEEEKLVTAEGLYRRALTLDDSYHEAQEALRKIQLLIQRAVQLREEAAAKELQKAKSVETSAEKLRKILKEEKRMKRKQRRSSSSSSTSSSSSSSSSNHTSSTSGRRKSKKKKGKHRRSSRGTKSQRRVSSRDVIVIGDDGDKEKDEEEEDEWYPAPPNTSASFLNRRLSLERHFEGPEEPSDPHSKAGGSSRRSQSHYSPSSASTEAPDNSRGRMEDEERSDGSPQPGEGSHGRGGQGGRQDSRAGAGDREENGRDRDTSQSRRSTQEDQQEELKHNRYRKLSTSSAGSERSRKSDRHSISELPSQTQTQAQTSASRRSDRGRYGSGTSHRSSDSGRYEATERGDKGEESRATRRSDGGDYRFPSDGSRNSQGRRDAGGSPKKELPSNLLDIFSQIAQFQKEKCVKPRK